MRVMGIDPGLASLGLAVVERQGPKVLPVYCASLTTEVAAPLGDRLLAIQTFLEEAVRVAPPDYAVVESMFFGKSRSAVRVGFAIGVICITMARLGIELRECSPPQVKQMVTGDKGADKDTVRKMVLAIMALKQVCKPNGKDAPDHVYDALALAINGLGARNPAAQQIAAPGRRGGSQDGKAFSKAIVCVPAK